MKEINKIIFRAILLVVGVLVVLYSVLFSLFCPYLSFTHNTQINTVPVPAYVFLFVDCSILFYHIHIQITYTIKYLRDIKYQYQYYF